MEAMAKSPRQGAASGKGGRGQPRGRRVPCTRVRVDVRRRAHSAVCVCVRVCLRVSGGSVCLGPCTTQNRLHQQPAAVTVPEGLGPELLPLAPSRAPRPALTPAPPPSVALCPSWLLQIPQGDASGRAWSLPET